MRNTMVFCRAVACLKLIGDLNATMACAITAKKLEIKVAHVEAGLRSRDRSMPEEINRRCTDGLCDYLFTTDHFANEDLLAEEIPLERIFFVGNVMIDTLLKHKKLARGLGLLEHGGLKPSTFATLTLHRPSNVDDPVILGVATGGRTIYQSKHGLLDNYLIQQLKNPSLKMVLA